MMKITHKTVKTLILCLTATFILTSCETLDQIGSSLGNLFSGKSSSADSEPAEIKTEKKTSKQKDSLKLPDSYDKAYSYKTGKADSSIAGFITDKKNEALRKSDPEAYIKQFCQKITNTSENPFERTKLAHDAVCLLLTYDAKNFWANTVPDQNWKTVLLSRTAVCEGYANLFKKVCDELKIPCQKIHGYARVGFNLMNEDTKENHAWNIVQIEEAWYLIDTTWDSGYMNGKNSVTKYTTEWLFTNPEQFIFTHFPKQEKYQLLTATYSSKDFMELPYLRPTWFDISQTAANNVPFTKINDAESVFEITTLVKSGWVYNYTIKNNSTNQIINNRIFSELTGDKENIIFSFPTAGTYTIDIFYGTKTSKSFESCGQFVVKTTKGSDIKYPTTYKNSCEGLAIIEPKTMPLSKGKTVHFEIKVQNKKNIAVICGKNFIQLENDGNGLFTGDVLIPTNISQLSIGASNSPAGKYETIASYEVK